MAHPGHQAPADHCYAGAEDVACDVCSGRKLKAQKLCLKCLMSFCESHLQPHFSPASETHGLVEPSKKLQEKICSHHKKVMEMFCRTDQQSICHLCPVDQHKDHDTVSATEEFQQRIQQIERDVKLLQQEVEAINGSADKAVEKSEKIFTELIRLLQQRRSDVKQQVRSQQQTEVSRVRELQEKLEQEISELKRKNQELEKLSLTQDHSKFLQDYPSLSQLREPPYSSSIYERPLSYFEDVTAAVSELRDKLRDVLKGTWTNILWAVTQVDVLLSEPRTRDEFFKYSRDITLDPNTAHKRLSLSDRNRKVTLKGKDRGYPEHRDRFTDYQQVLSKESLTGRCYWEVEVSRKVSVAVSYKSISRANMQQEESALGWNNKSWVLDCDTNIYVLRNNAERTPISGPVSSRVGVYLDHRAGILSFYRVSETMTRLHRVQTTFTEPLHAGIWIDYVGSSAKLCKLN